MSETREEREARWAKSRAAQVAYAASEERRTARLARIASGLCVIDVITGEDICVVHGCVADFGHYLDARPAADNGHNPRTGIAYND